MALLKVSLRKGTSTRIRTFARPFHPLLRKSFQNEPENIQESMKVNEKIINSIRCAYDIVIIANIPEFEIVRKLKYSHTKISESSHPH